MKVKKIMTVSLFVAGFAIANTVQASGFWKSGTVQRILVDEQFYGGCMMLLSTRIANGCPNNGWISLDCEGKFGKNGKSMLNSAMMAMYLGKKVSAYVHNHWKINSYCVARRIDLTN